MFPLLHHRDQSDLWECGLIIFMALILKWATLQVVLFLPLVGTDWALDLMGCAHSDQATHCYGRV